MLERHGKQWPMEFYEYVFGNTPERRDTNQLAHFFFPSAALYRVLIEVHSSEKDIATEVFEATNTYRDVSSRAAACKDLVTEEGALARMELFLSLGFKPERPTAPSRRSLPPPFPLSPSPLPPLPTPGTFTVIPRVFIIPQGSPDLSSLRQFLSSRDDTRSPPVGGAAGGASLSSPRAALLPYVVLQVAPSLLPHAALLPYVVLQVAPSLLPHAALLPYVVLQVAPSLLPHAALLPYVVLQAAPSLLPHAALLPYVVLQAAPSLLLEFAVVLPFVVPFLAMVQLPLVPIECVQRIELAQLFFLQLESPNPWQACQLATM